MTIGYPPVQSQRPNDDERTVYLRSKSVDPAGGRPIPTPSQSDPRGWQPDPRGQSFPQGQQSYPQGQQSYPPANAQYPAQQGYGQYGWGNQPAPAPQSSGGSRVAIIAIAAVVAVISAGTLGFALTRPGKHDAQAQTKTMSQSGDQSAQKSAGKPAEQTTAPPAVAPTLPPSAIPGVLMTLPEAAAVLGVGAVQGADELGDKIYTMSKSTIVDQDCVSTLPAQMDTYQGSGYSDLRQQFLSGVTDNVRMTQSAATFTDAAAAFRFVTATKARWQKCVGRTINFRASNDPAAPNTFFVFGAVSQTDNVVNISSTQEGQGDWTCQNGLTTRANVVIDLMVCGHGMQASVARAATDKISQKITAAIPR